MRKITITKYDPETNVHTFEYDDSIMEREAVLIDAIGKDLKIFNEGKYVDIAEWIVGRRYFLSDDCAVDENSNFIPVEGQLIPILRIKKFIISYAHLVTLLRGEHHYEMKLGLPLDAKIIHHEGGDERARGVVITVESKEFDEYESIEECKEFGNLNLSVLPCMPILSAKVTTK